MFGYPTINKRNPLLWLSAVLGLALFAGQACATPIATGFDTNTLSLTDDGSAGPIDLGFTVDFFNHNYSQIYINNNGNVTFGSSLSTFTPFNFAADTSTPIIAPFFADVSSTTTGNPLTYGTGHYGGHNAFGVNWPGVTGYGLSSDNLNDFQLLLVDRADTGAGNFDIYFNYGSITWDTGSRSTTSAGAGFSNGSGITGTYYEISGSGSSGDFLDSGSDPLIGATNDNVPGQFLFEIRSSDSQRQPTDPVPEPATVALIGAGLLCLAALRRRRVPV